LVIRYLNARYPDCKKYRPQPKPEKRNHWGSQLLAGLKINKGKPKKSSPGQMAFPWAQWEVPDSEIQEVAEKFVFANCYNPQAAEVMLWQR
jgi:putative transposase